MIRIRYHGDRDHHCLRIRGHAGYAPAGSDIVCAGVSALSLALLAYLRQTGEGDGTERSGEMTLRCRRTEKTDGAVQTALTGYLQIAGTYPQHVEVHITPAEAGERSTQYVPHQHHGN